MVKSEFFLIMATLSLVVLPIGACTSQPGSEQTPDEISPTPTSELEVTDATKARDIALAYLRENESENAPSTDIVWEEENITPPGAAGIRGEVIEFTSDEWTITVSYPVPPPEETEYGVAVANTKLGWRWNGTVKADGSVVKFDPFKQVNKEKSRVIAEEFLRNSPTFVTSGIEETLRLTDTIIPFCPFCWTFIFEFDSRHAGYGDTSGQAVAEVITPHRAVIAIEQFKVASAIMDDKWDMMKQEMIGEE